MCTAITFPKKHFYFGRTLDLEYSYRESVTVCPRNFPLAMRMLPDLKTHHALIGMAFVQEGFPLYYEAVNEHGLCMAGLNFPSNAHYPPAAEGKTNVAPFEFIPYLLGTCENLEEARAALETINLCNVNFSEALPLSPLHYMIADKTGAIVAEPMEDGLHVYDNPVGVMTNNPPFPMQMDRLNDYMSLTVLPPENTFCPGLPLRTYSRGMGGMGLPGDLSSASRFVRAAFVRCNSLCGDTEEECVGQFFHILGAVEQQRGCVKLGERYEITVYTSCCNADTGAYYYTTYGNRRIRCVELRHEDLNGTALASYPISTAEDIERQN